MSLKFADYIATEGCNWSTLKEISRSPLHYQYRKTHPRADSTTLARGRAVHTAVLEPEKFDSDYVVYPGKIRRGKEWDAFVEAYEGRTILKADERDKVWAAAEAVRRHSEVAALMRSGEAEKSFTWVDPGSGLPCKCRVDWIGDALFDLKTTGDVDERRFGNLAARMLYYGQCAMYSDGAGHKGPVYIVAVEAEPPHDVAVYQLDEDILFAGRELYQGFLLQVAECQASGVWSGRYPQKTVLTLPRYVYEDGQDDGTAVVVETEEV